MNLELTECDVTYFGRRKFHCGKKVRVGGSVYIHNSVKLSSVTKKKILQIASSYIETEKWHDFLPSV